MEKKLSKIQKAKIKALQPILDRWNRVQSSNWIVRADATNNGVEVVHEPGRHCMHGSLVSDIGGVCNAYKWTWAAYYYDELGINLNI